METREKIERRLLDARAEFYYVDSVDVRDIDIETSLKNQARISEAVVEDIVSIYSVGLKAGDIFPPIILEKRKNKYVICDGNHRIKALISNNETVWNYGAYIVTGISEMQFRAILYNSNLTHGLPASVNDRIKHAIYLINTTGISQREASEKMRIPVSRVNAEIKYMNNSDRMRRVGLVKLAGTMPKGHIDALNPIQDDEVFMEACKFVGNSKMIQDDVSNLSKEIRDKKKSSLQIEYLKSLSETNEKIKTITAGEDDTLKSVLKLLKRISMLANKIQPDDYLKIPEDIRKDVLKTITDIINKLGYLK